MTTTQRLLNIGIILAFLVVYLEWGKDNGGFMFQLEYSIFAKPTDPTNTFMHPLVAVPLCGQILVLATLFQKKPNRRLTTIGILLMAVLVIFISFIGIAGLHAKIALSTVPFLLLSFLHFRKKNMGSKLPGSQVHVNDNKPN